MRDAFGGLVNIIIVVVFLVVITGYLAFNVNYTKAFRVKNKIITTIEQYEGNCEQFSACDQIIQNYIAEIGYNVHTNPNMCTALTCSCRNGYCVEKVDKDTGGAVGVDDNGRYYYRVITATSIDVPMVNRIMPGLKLFQISGNTKTFKK